MEAHTTTPEPAESQASDDTVEKATGPVVAILLATGIGALVLGILTVWATASEGFKESIAYSDRVGPLAGKTIWASAAFLASWGGLHLALRERRAEVGKALVVAAILLGLGYLGTFAPFFELFEPE